jgi:predicted O-methyltransferase YrrM
LEHSVTTGAPAFPHTFGAAYFDYLQAHPDADEVFNEAMTGLSVHLFGAVVDAYDFRSFGTIVDVGGSYGALLSTVLRAAPDARGVLFDQPHVAAIAAERLAAGDVADRCSTVGGDFFAELPDGADAYLLSQILHDWDDADAIRILTCCRRSIPADGTLLVVDFVLPENDEPAISKWVDLHMMVLLGARERTASELDELLAAAGFRRGRIVPTSAGPSIIVATPA